MNPWSDLWVSKKRRGLRGWVLLSLGHAPKNGAELMDEMERMSGGWWRPSPGSIYPLLEELSKEELVHKRADGRYDLAAKIRDGLGSAFGPFGPRTAEDAVKELSGLASFLEELGGSRSDGLDRVRAQLKDVADRLARLSS